MSSSKGGPSKQEKGKEVAKTSTDENKPIFYPDRPDYIHDSGICTAFVKSGVLPEGKVFESPLHDFFCRGIKICSITGRGEESYCVWVLDQPTNKRALIGLFPNFLLNEDVEFFHRNIKILTQGRTNEVFVEKINGKPYGKYMSLICKDKDIRRGCALLVAFFGSRNSSPCDCCLERMSRNFSNGMPVMVPFFECRSIQGFHGNACANCLFHIEGHLCSFKNSHIPKVAEATPPIGTEFKDIPQSELFLGPYTHISAEYAYNEERAKAVEQVVGFKPQVQKPRPKDQQPWK